MNEIEDIIGPIIGLVSATLFMSIPIIYIVMRSRRLQRAVELLHAERMAAIERGMDVPTSSLEILGDEIASTKKQRTALLPGLVWLFVGLAIAASRLSEDYGHGAPLLVGFVPIGIGLAYLIYYFVEERRQLAGFSPP